MTLPSPSLSDCLFAGTLLGYLLLGSVVGVLHFTSVRRTAEALVEARGKLAAMLFASRLALTGGTLALVSLEGALPLLTAVAGLTIGRFAVVRAGSGARP